MSLKKNILLSQICQPFLLNALRFVRGTSHGGTVTVVVEAGDAVAVGGADEVTVQVVLVNGFLNLVVVAGEGMGLNGPIHHV